jgi:hypothetical protein
VRKGRDNAPRIPQSCSVFNTHHDVERDIHVATTHEPVPSPHEVKYPILSDDGPMGAAGSEAPSRQGGASFRSASTLTRIVLPRPIEWFHQTRASMMTDRSHSRLFLPLMASFMIYKDASGTTVAKTSLMSDGETNIVCSDGETLALPSDCYPDGSTSSMTTTTGTCP